MKSSRSVLCNLIALAVVPFCSIPVAQAAFVNSPVPANAFITFKGLQWAWANPCAPTDPTCGAIDLSYQSTQGWRLPTLAEVLAGPSGPDFVFAGANVNVVTNLDPVSGAYNAFLPTGGDFACATPYFSGIFHHCDYGDELPSNDGLYPTGNAAEETWVVRRGGAPLPEPVTLALFGAAFAGLSLVRRRGAKK